MTFARSPPGTTVGGWELIPHLKPVGHQSTNWMVLLVLMVATAALTSLGTTSPRYMRQHAMYFPWRGSHLTIIAAGSKTELVISATESCSWYAFSAEMIGAYDVNIKWIRGYGTKLVGNSISRLRRQISYRASLSTWLVTSVCSNREWTHARCCRARQQRWQPAGRTTR